MCQATTVTGPLIDTAAEPVEKVLAVALSKWKSCANRWVPILTTPVPGVLQIIFETFQKCANPSPASYPKTPMIPKHVTVYAARRHVLPRFETATRGHSGSEKCHALKRGPFGSGFRMSEKVVFKPKP